MKIIDILSSPWAIQPEKLTEIVEIYRAHTLGDKLDLAAIEARIGKTLDNEQPRYTVTADGVAVIPIEGVLGKKMNMFSQISGGSSTQLIGQDFQEALNRPDVKAILLEIDSPGGTVDGTQQLAQEIFQARGKKPMATLVDGLMASAAAYIGAAADNVYINGDFVQTGSISIVTSHKDISRAEEAAGIKTTEIYTGRFKRIASQYAPLTQEGKDYIQSMLDVIHTQFIDDLAKFRGMTPEAAQEKMGDGRIFIGSQGIAAGLVDGIKTKSEVMAILIKQSQERKQKMENDFMAKLTVDILMDERPDLVKSIVADGWRQGAADESARIQAVESQMIPGHEKLVRALMYDGKTSGPEAAVQVINAEKINQAKILKTLEAEAPKPAALSADVPAEVTDQTPKEKWDSDKELQASFAHDFGAFEAYMKAEAAGRVKLFTGRHPVK